MESNISSSPANMVVDQADMIFQNTAYFGIFYPEHLIDEVNEALNASEFKALANADGPGIVLPEGKIFASTNTNIDDLNVVVSCGFIVVEEMSREGPDCDNPTASTVTINPAELLKLEVTYKAAVLTIGAIYELILKKFKAKKINTNGVEKGWKVISCAWEDFSSSSEEPVAKPVARSVTKLAAIKQPAAKQTTTKQAAKQTTTKPVKSTAVKKAPDGVLTPAQDTVPPRRGNAGKQ